MKSSRRDLASRVVKLGSIIRQYRSKGKLQSVAPPTIFSYRAFLRLARTLPKLSLKQVALATMLGNATSEDRKLVATVLKDTFDEEDPDDEDADKELSLQKDNEQFPYPSPTWFKYAECASPEFAVTDHRSGVYPYGALDSADEIFEEIVEPRENPDAAMELEQEALPLIELMNASLFASRNRGTQTQRRMTTGSLDPLRLAAVSFDSAIFRKWPLPWSLAKVDLFFLIACDASGSVAPGHMEIIKTLSLAFMRLALGKGLGIVVGLYSSGRIGKGRSGPVVRWVYHPEKTSNLKISGIAYQAASLPNHGTGVQSDALSLLVMMEEAQRMARGQPISLTLITDGQWNSSFGVTKGEQEVRCFFESARNELCKKFHSTLIVVGAGTETGLEDVVDKAIVVPTEALVNVSNTAQQIACWIGQTLHRMPLRPAGAKLDQWCL